MSKKHDFTGFWTLHHVYPGFLDNNPETGEYKVEAKQVGDEIVFQSVPNKAKDNYMFVRLKIDGIVATGSWQEKSQSKGPYEGVMYSGAGQLIVSEDGKSMDGLWAGVGIDRKAKKPKVYCGQWSLEKLAS